jgi:hypothetical protein
MTEDLPGVHQVRVSLAANTLEFRLVAPLTAVQTAAIATIEVGTRGRLIGLETVDWYLPISDPEPNDAPHLRSIDVLIEISADGYSVTIPRRGPGWELSFPSGNQCWRVRSGAGAVRTVCSVQQAD